MQAASCLAAPRKVDNKCRCFSGLENIYIFCRLNTVTGVSNPSLLHGAQPLSLLIATLSPWSALQTWALIFISITWSFISITWTFISIIISNGHVQFGFGLASARVSPQWGSEPAICVAHVERGCVGFAQNPSGGGGGTDRLGKGEGGTCNSFLNGLPHEC